MSGILEGQERLVSISCLCYRAVACSVCPALCGKVLPALLKHPLSFACRTPGGCSHRRVLLSENVGHLSLWNLGSLVVSHPCAAARKLSCCHMCPFAFSSMFATITGHLFPPVLPLMLWVLRGWRCSLFFMINFSLALTINPSVYPSEFLGYHWSSCLI